MMRFDDFEVPVRQRRGGFAQYTRQYSDTETEVGGVQNRDSARGVRERVPLRIFESRRAADQRDPVRHAICERTIETGWRTEIDDDAQLRHIAPSARRADRRDQFESGVAMQQILECTAHAAVGTVDGEAKQVRHGRSPAKDKRAAYKPTVRSQIRSRGPHMKMDYKVRPWTSPLRAGLRRNDGRHVIPAPRMSTRHLRPELLDAFHEAAVAWRMLLRFLRVGEGGFELLQQVALELVEPHRCFDDHGAEKVAGVAAANGLHALAAQPEFLPRLRFRRDGDAGHAAEDRDFDGCAERGLRETDRHLATQVVAMALEDRMLAHVDLDVQVAGRRAGRAGFALACQANAIAVVHAGGHFHFQAAFVFEPSFAVTVSARRHHHAPDPAAMRTGLLDRENAVLHPHATVAAAGRAGGKLAVLRTRAIAVMAVDHRRHADLLVDAGHGFFEVEIQHVAQIRTACRAPAATEDVGKDVAEDVAHVPERRAAATPCAVLERGVAVLVVHRAALRIAQYLPSLLGFLEALLRFGIAGTAVGMILHRQPAKRLFQFLVIRRACNTEDFVVATFHVRILASRRRSGMNHSAATAA